MTKPAYQFGIEHPTMEIEYVRSILSVLPSINFVLEDKFQSLAGPMRIIRADVEVEASHSMSQEQRAALRSLGTEMKNNLFYNRWEPGEFETFQERKRQEEENIRIAKIHQAIADGARYFICSFRQEQEPWRNPETNLSYVHPVSFPGTDREEADKQAEKLEKERYNKNDHNVRILARLAKSEEDAKAGRFLD